MESFNSQQAQREAVPVIPAATSHVEVSCPAQSPQRQVLMNSSALPGRSSKSSNSRSDIMQAHLPEKLTVTCDPLTVSSGFLIREIITCFASKEESSQMSLQQLVKPSDWPELRNWIQNSANALHNKQLPEPLKYVNLTKLSKGLLAKSAHFSLHVKDDEEDSISGEDLAPSNENTSACEQLLLRVRFADFQRHARPARDLQPATLRQIPED